MRRRPWPRPTRFRLRFRLRRPHASPPKPTLRGFLPRTCLPLPAKPAAARPHFSRPAAHSRDRKPAQSSAGSRPARRPGRDARSSRGALGKRFAPRLRRALDAQPVRQGQPQRRATRATSANGAHRTATATADPAFAPMPIRPARKRRSAVRKVKTSAAIRAKHNGHAANGNGHASNGNGHAPTVPPRRQRQSLRQARRNARGASREDARPERAVPKRAARKPAAPIAYRRPLLTRPAASRL